MDRNLFLNKLLQNDEQAINTLVLENKDAVFRTCLAYVQHVADAEDLTQEVFIRAMERLDQYKGDAKLSSWLIRIAINLSKNFLRDNRKRLNSIEPENIHLADTRKNPQYSVIIKKMVRNAVYKLPEKQRTVFILSNYLDLSYKEITDVTGFSNSSIESLLFRARRKLRYLLHEFYEDLNS
jgi:RNA polymerase sigma-70 factor (ECF subfamily)